MNRTLTIRLWRRYHQLRFRWLDHRRHNSLVLEKVGGIDLLVLPKVFNPALFWTSELLVRHLEEVSLETETRVLDLGTGSGIGAICAARRSRNVFAVDINPEAVRCTQINAFLNKVDDRVTVLKGDLFAPVQTMKFDLVLFNPPFFRGQPRTSLEAAFFEGGLADKFAQGLPHNLTLDGYCLLILSTDGESEKFQLNLQKNQLEVKPVREERLPGETLTVYQVSPKPS